MASPPPSVTTFAGPQTLAERLDKIRQPRLQSQKEVAIVLNAIEETLKEQNIKPEKVAPSEVDSANAGSAYPSTAYFGALLSLLPQSLNATHGLINKELATAILYLLGTITPYVPAGLLRAKFETVVTSILPALSTAVDPKTNVHIIDAPLLRPAIGTLESVLLAQDAASWAIPPTQTSPRQALVGLLSLANDHRPKVRKRALEALSKVLRSTPSGQGPRIDHPASEMCADAAMKTLRDLGATNSKKSQNQTQKGQRPNNKNENENSSALIHGMQLVKTVAGANGGWPARKIDSLCEILFAISRNSHEYLSLAAFDVFELMFAGILNQGALGAAKLPRLMEILNELKPAKTDSQLLPAWAAILSRAYEVSAHLEPEETFVKSVNAVDVFTEFLSSSSHAVRSASAEALLRIFDSCIPDSAILDPSVYDEKMLEQICAKVTGLLSVKYQGSWMEVFTIIASLLETLRWRASPLLDEAVKTVGALRSDDSFNGKKEADIVLGKAISSMGPETICKLLPLNLNPSKANNGPGRAWLLPILRDSVVNTNMAHFKSELVPLSEVMFQRVLDHGKAEKTMEIKIYETIVQQIWATFPGYCTLPLDLTTTFDQSFAEMVSNLLYTQTTLRVDVCRGLQTLVESFKEIRDITILDGEEEDLLEQRRISRATATANLQYLSGLAGNLLAVLFNVYSTTLPENRGYILQCVNAYLSITAEQDILDTFKSVTTMLEAEIPAEKSGSKPKKPITKDGMPPTSHTLMDLVITISIYLPISVFPALFTLASRILPLTSDPQLQKKAYKLLPRLSTSEAGALALTQRNSQLQALLLETAETVSAPAKRDRLAAISVVVENLPPQDMHFIPSILSEVVISAKEVNEKARTVAFDLLVLMGEKMSVPGGVVRQSLIPHMESSSPDAVASLEEFFTMVSAGLAGATPHMISASVIALTRILYEFHRALPESVLEDLVSTMDLFLGSTNREIVRACLGFVKVAVLSLPVEIIRPRLPTLIPGLMTWSHEHKARFRTKVKGILERCIRRFGYELIERLCPDSERRVLVNIRKTKERKKRKGAEAANDDEMDEDDMPPGRKGRQYTNEFDEVLGDNSDESDASEIDGDEELRNASNKTVRAKGNAYILDGGENDEEPLDLLDRSALGRISTTRPQASKSKDSVLSKRKRAVKTDMDGKLIFGDDDKQKDDEDDTTKAGNGLDAYVDAISGRDAVRRGQSGKLKISSGMQKKSDRERERNDRMDLDDDDDVDDDDNDIATSAKAAQAFKRGGGGRGGFRGKQSPRGGRFGNRGKIMKGGRGGRGNSNGFRGGKGVSRRPVS